MTAAVENLRSYAGECWRPEMDEAVWRWAERCLWIPETENEEAPGPLNTGRTPYVREWMECFRDPGITDCAIMTGAQVAKTISLMAGLAWLIANDPRGILWVFPNERLARSFSESRWERFLRASHVMADLVPEDEDEFKLLEQHFPRATLNFEGSNSPANLSSRPKPVVLQDETDKLPGSSEKEAGASMLADQRTKRTAFPKRLKTSTPTTEGGVIHREYLRGDQRRYRVPCARCGVEIELLFEQIRFEWCKTGEEWDLERVGREAWYECQVCGGRIEDEDKPGMLAGGRWMPTNPSPAPGCRSYHLPSWYAPWPQCGFGATAVKFLTAKAQWALKDFDNNERGMPSRERGEKADWKVLAARREAYPQRVPQEVLVTTAAVDVQDDRLECEILGWGSGFESWLIEYHVFHGDPARGIVWTDAERWLFDPDRTPVIESITCDTGGHYTEEAYAWVARQRASGRPVYAIRGANVSWAPLVGRPSKRNKHRVKLWPVGTDTAKVTILAWLKVAEHGPGYCHFPEWLDDEYFKQLAAEELRVKYVRGFEKREFYKIRKRNEALDLRVYNLAALKILPPNVLEVRAREQAELRAGENQIVSEDSRRILRPEAGHRARERRGPLGWMKW